MIIWQNPQSSPWHKSKKNMEIWSSEKNLQSSPWHTFKKCGHLTRTKDTLTWFQKYDHLTWKNPQSGPWQKFKKCGHLTKTKETLTWFQKYDHLTKIPKHRLNRIQKNDLQLSKTQKHPRDKWKIFDCPTACFKERSGHVKYARYFFTNTSQHILPIGLAYWNLEPTGHC